MSRRLGIVLPYIMGGGWLLDPELIVERQHAGTAAIAPQFKAAACLGFDRHQNAGGKSEQSVEIIRRYRRRAGRGCIGESRGIDRQGPAVGEMKTD